ncbi:efflux transporter, outer membrane factor (OMF) lipoprotein, NodT family [Dyella jiangningensis]|uniref:efflux transporter outer membrane subunit n=1 Tax=Dyella sp. AtDHG13 TaxID=1938897 RepID=UPI0008881453|nr:efflux transporter outer membrane subunit [Dyella sp. AtDHG13]PXV61817.1 NodT family efflux transporter outer membrane factor (OMF) lipoprotein [Dyella sp. AtDHG13]SDJ62881.1 efflux transporter, outer membrane factor (OMF) lipoprotein, NodT family [Dyella jiangningensis]
MNRHPTLFRNAFAISLAVALSGCMVGPDYHRPEVSTPPQYKELPGWSTATPADDAPKGEWWKAFNDPLLDELEPQVATSNQTVAKSYADYQAAMADVQVARSALFPTIGISGAASKQRSAAGNAGSGVEHLRPVSTSGSLEGNVSWAPDFWGKVRRTVEENKATAQASQATLANAVLTEQTALATAVIDLRVTDANIDLLQKTVDAYKEYLRVVENQGKAGTIAPSDVITARTQLENAQSKLIALGVSREQYVHAIAVLAGKNPEELDVPHNATLPSLPQVPTGVPSTLLQRRPDIAVAEREMASANAAIGVAVAAYYPSISLSAADGFSQSPLAGLLHVANHVWSLGADVSETIFDAGARHGQVAAARANYESAVANYRGTVLAAFQNVEDDLSGVRILAQQAQVLDAAVKDATRGAEIAFNEYNAGTVDYTTAATAQTTQLSTEQDALSVQQQRLLDAVSLIGDLGGGWSADELAHAPTAPVTKVAK